MGNKELRLEGKDQFFEKTESEEDTGVRDMYPLAPFIISGGRNTERYYFVHVNDLSDKYKFNIRPKYFGDESSYTKVFPQRIKEILTKNVDAVVFCVFDMDTVFKDNLYDKHNDFIESIKEEIYKGKVILCDSMPSFEYWLLLHFVDHNGLLKDYSDVSQVLAPYIKPYFGNPSIQLKKLLKSRKHLQNNSWVKKMLEEGLLEDATKRAQKGDNLMDRSKDIESSYTNVYKIFISQSGK